MTITSLILDLRDEKDLALGVQFARSGGVNFSFEGDDDSLSFYLSRDQFFRLMKDGQQIESAYAARREAAK